MTTNKFSKYVIDNIVVGTPISSIIAAGATIGLDSAAVIDLIDSDYVAARTPSANGFDSADVIGIVDSDYIQARITLDGVGIDSATAQSIANSEILSIVDAAYVQARQTPQDFAYSSLTGAPTALSSFTNDTNYITAADIPATVDSDYVAARAPAAAGGLDSAGVTALISEPYLRDTLYDVATAQTNIGLDAGFASTSNFSIAIGKESGINSGNATNSIALGFKAGQSISDNSIMIGRETGEVGAGSYSVGIGTEALGIGAGAGSVAIGYFASKSSAGSNSVAVGRQASATGDNAIAIGNTVTATTVDAVTIGSSVAGRVTYDTTTDWTFGATVNAPAFVGDGSGLTGLPTGGGLDSAGVQLLIDADLIGSGINSVAIGEGASTPSADNTVAVGINAEAAADYAVSIGDNATVSHPAVIGIAIGRNTSVTTPGGVGGVAIGSGASVSDNDTLAIGRNTVASAADATAIGPNTTASGLRSIAIGNNVAAITDDAVTIGSSVAGRVTYDTTNDWTFGAGVTMTDLVASGATVVFNNLPTVDPVNAGQLWNDAGTMKISAG